jgi:triacylglycerol lipase
MEYQEFLQTEWNNYQLSLLFANESYLDTSEYLHKDKRTDTQYVFKKINNEYFISFAGTESIKDALLDSNISKRTVPYLNNNSNILIHNGFYKAYTSARNELQTLIRNHYQSGNKFFISGHSLGGALALLCALDIQYNFDIKEDEVFLITLGQPRTGNEAFKNSTNRRLKNYFRFVNGDDVVPKWPKFGYEHCGKLIEIGEKKWYKPASLEDHCLANYLRKLLDFT